MPYSSIFNNKKEFGNMAEQVAVFYLKKENYQILKRNFYTKFGENDIIALKAKELVFVEVKARDVRSKILWELPETTVNFKKRKKIKKSAEIFLTKHQKYFNYIIRFDVITILFFNYKIRLRHIKYISM